MNDFPHYFKELPPGCTHVDVYRVLDLFGVVDPPIQHAIKKLLCAGERGNKTMPQDIAEAIATLQRWQQMREEESTPVTPLNLYTSPIAEVQPAPAEYPERSAYLRRWEGAPAEATYLAECASGACWWHSQEPGLRSAGDWTGGTLDYAGQNLLGSVRCEPRPGVEP